MNLSYKILIGLFAGFLFGLFIAQNDSQWLNGLPAMIAPLGSLWVNAIRMTIVPLLMSLVIVAIGGTEQSHRVLAIGGAGSLLIDLRLVPMPGRKTVWK